MLSFLRGRPVGYVTGGKRDNSEICIIDDIGPSDAVKANPVRLLGEDYFKRLRNNKGKKLNAAEMKEIIVNLPKGTMPENKELSDPFTEALEKYIDIDCKEILLEDDGIVQHIPDFEAGENEQMEVLFIVGPSGSGKSTYLRNFVAMLLAKDPERRIVLYSRLDSDKVLDELEPERADIAAEFGKTEEKKGREAKRTETKTIQGAPPSQPKPPCPRDFKDAVVIFDDIDTIPDEKQQKGVQKLRDDLMETGRHENITVISVSHKMYDYAKTRTCHSEATCTTFFPRLSSKTQVKRFLKDEAGLEPAQSRKVMALPSRWVTFFKRAPQFFLHEKGAITF